MDERLEAINKFAERNKIEVFEELPEGYKVTSGALSAPIGSSWIDNGKSRFAGERKSALLINKWLLEELRSEETLREEAARFVNEYADNMESRIENNKNFLIEDSDIFPFEINEDSHAAVRHAYISRGNRFDDAETAGAEVVMNIVAAVYKDGTSNDRNQDIEEIRFTLKGTKDINDFCEQLDLSVKKSIKEHPDMQPIVTINYSEYDNQLLKDHTRLSLDKANDFFELADMVARDENEEGYNSAAYYKTSADIMYIKDGKIEHYDLRQDFGDGDGSLIKHMEKFIDNEIWNMERSKQPDAADQLKKWKSAKEELIPYFNRHISVSSTERNLEYLPEDKADIMRGKISELRMFLNTGMVVTEREQTPQQTAEQKNNTVELEKAEESDFSRQVDEVLSGKADRYNDIKVCDTPEILTRIGCENLPMFITQAHIKDIIHTKDTKNPHWHGLTLQQLKNIPDLLTNPVMIFDSASIRKDSIVIALDESDNEKLPVIVSVKPNGKGVYELSQVDSNFITSIYGKDNFSSYAEKVINEGRMLYCNKQKSQELFSVLGLQLPQGFNNLDFNKIIHQSNNIVKNEAPHSRFKILYYEGGEKKSIYTDRLEAGFDIIRNNDTGLKDTDRCYVGIYSGEAGKYVSSDIYLIKSGENITPVPLELPKVKGKEAFARLTSGIKALGAKFDGKQWTVAKNVSPENLKKINDMLARFDPDKTYLTLPAMGRDKFKILTEKLKEDGANFDPVKKQWYITRTCDKEKFSDYIPVDRSSVLEKLQDKKDAAKDNEGTAGAVREDKETDKEMNVR